MVACACGCGESIRSMDGNGESRKFVFGHNNRALPEGHVPKRILGAKVIPCGCGCGGSLPEYNRHGNKQAYIYGHTANKRWGDEVQPVSLRPVSQDPRAVYQRNRKWARKIAILTHYSEGDAPLCACCGEANPVFLAVDHIAGDGNIHRKGLNSKGGYSFYLWLIREQFPPGFRVLCHNCNHAFGCYGYCPHNPR